MLSQKSGMQPQFLLNDFTQGDFQMCDRYHLINHAIRRPLSQERWMRPWKQKHSPNSRKCMTTRLQKIVTGHDNTIQSSAIA